MNMAPECEICGENAKAVYECEICGTTFCKECGKPSEKICMFCSEEEEEEQPE
jgi:predicted nucleic acid binding AN1-type Zn finger protein